MGDKVMASCKGSKKQYPGTIFKDNRDGTFDVKFDDGDRDRAVPERGIAKEGGSKPASKSGFGGRSPPAKAKSSFGGRSDDDEGKWINAKVQRFSGKKKSLCVLPEGAAKESE